LVIHSPTSAKLHPAIRTIPAGARAAYAIDYPSASGKPSNLRLPARWLQESATAKVTTPGGFDVGAWVFTNVIKQSVGTTKNSQGNCLSVTTSDFYLDEFAYMPPIPPDTVPYPANGSLHGAQDTPGVDGTDLSNAKADMSFKTYIMFKPAGSTSRFVALKTASWGIKYCGSAGTPWVISNSTRTPLTGNPTFQDPPGFKQPEWDANLLNVSPASVECPSPFCP
jgi:hypothetical protein